MLFIGLLSEKQLKHFCHTIVYIGLIQTNICSIWWLKGGHVQRCHWRSCCVIVVMCVCVSGGWKFPLWCLMCNGQTLTCTSSCDLPNFFANSKAFTMDVINLLLYEFTVWNVLCSSEYAKFNRNLYENWLLEVPSHLPSPKWWKYKYASKIDYAMQGWQASRAYILLTAAWLSEIQ